MNLPTWAPWDPVRRCIFRRLSSVILRRQRLSTLERPLPFEMPAQLADGNLILEDVEEEPTVLPPETGFLPADVRGESNRGRRAERSAGRVLGSAFATVLAALGKYAYLRQRGYPRLAAWHKARWHIQ